MMRSLRGMVTDQQVARDGSVANDIRTIRATVTPEEPKRSTFIVEALLLLTCLMIVIAVSISVIAFAAARGAESSHEENAIIMATNIAEQFAADPNSLQERYVDGDYVATCALSISMDTAGSLYDTTIDIDWKGTRIYALSTSKYVSRSDVALFDQDEFDYYDEGGYHDDDLVLDYEDEDIYDISDDGDERWVD